KSARDASALIVEVAATVAFTSSSIRVLSPPPRTNWLMKSVARRIGSPSGTPKRSRSLAFIRQALLTWVLGQNNFGVKSTVQNCCSICYNNMHDGSALSEAQIYRGCCGV